MDVDQKSDWHPFSLRQKLPHPFFKVPPVLHSDPFFQIPPSCQGMEKLIEWSGKRLDAQLLSPEAVVKEYRDLLKDPGEMYKK